jgi:hypothetical protein
MRQIQQRMQRLAAPHIPQTDEQIPAAAGQCMPIAADCHSADHLGMDPRRVSARVVIDLPGWLHACRTFVVRSSQAARMLGPLLELPIYYRTEGAQLQESSCRRHMLSPSHSSSEVLYP